MEVEYRTELPEKEALYTLYDHLGWNDYLKLDENQLLEAMKGSSYAVYAYSGSQLVGIGRVISDGMINGYLCGLAVHSAFRHRGIATTIINRLCEFCEEKNLHIQFFCEEHLVEFYENMGFTCFARGMTKMRN